MTGPSVTTEHIKYLERAFLDGAGPVDLGDASAVRPPEEALRLHRVRSIPRPDHGAGGATGHLSGMADVLTGLSGVGEAVGLALVGDGSSVGVYVASWPAATGGRSNPGRPGSPSERTLADLLAGAYPGIEAEAVDPGLLGTALEPLSEAALMTGSPATDHSGGAGGGPGDPPRPDPAAGVGVDRLIRSMTGRSWAYVASATPLGAERVEGLSDRTLNELRSVRNTVERAEGETSIAAAYRRSLGVLRERLATGRASGAWHTVGYLLAEDRATLGRARAVATGAFGGHDSRPDPVRTIDVSRGAGLAGRFGLPTAVGPDPPGTFQYPYRFPAVLSSGEVASMLHLPSREASGFHVRPQRQFDVTPHDRPDDDGAVTLGTVLDAGRPTEHTYAVGTEDLTRHGLVVGTTGSGKTNTVFHVLRQLADRGVPFLVVEPAKTEYRRLLDSELGEDLQVFTLGDETTAPFRINPFEIRPGVPVQAHIDHLTALFNASFVMYAPMPYVLERCIHEIYEDRGWDLVTGRNRRGRAPQAQPTVTDLYEKVDPVVASLGYEREVTQDVSAALKTRIDNLRIGSKGLMLDTHASVPVEDLLGRPTVLELDAVGDDAEKAFLMGLVMFSLYEHHQSTGPDETEGLRHVTVLEEAHRLLSAGSGGGGPESSNMAGQAVESFTNLLAEIRAYGEGMLVVDQTPAKLAPTVVKNTNLKVVHRLLADDDRRLLGGSMGADATRTRWLGLSRVGEAAVFGSDDDSPILVKVPYRKVALDGKGETDARTGAGTDADPTVTAGTAPTGGTTGRAEREASLSERIRERAARLREAHAAEYDAYPWVAAAGTDVRRHRRQAWPAVDDASFRDALARAVHAARDDEADLGRAAGDLVDTVADLVPTGRLGGLLVPVLVIGIEDRIERHGAAVDAPYETLEVLKAAFASRLAGALSDDERIDATRITGTGTDESATTPFGERYAAVFGSATCPCTGYGPVGGGDEERKVERSCRYHLDTARLVESGLGSDLAEALAGGDGDLWERVATVIGEAAGRVVPPDAAPVERRRAERCAAVGAAASVDTIDARLRSKLVDGLRSTWTTGGEA